MKFLVIFILFFSSFVVHAISLSSPPSLTLTKSPTKTTFNFGKGPSNVPAPSLSLNKQITTTFKVPDNSVLKIITNQPKQSLIQRSLSILKRVSPYSLIPIVCSMYCNDVEQIIKDWLHDAVLDTDSDGNPTKSNSPCGLSGVKIGGVCYTSNNPPCYWGDCNVSGWLSGGYPACSGECDPNAPVTYSPTPLQEVIDKLMNTPLSDEKFDELVNKLHEIAKANNDPSIEPESDEDPVISDDNFTPDGGGGGDSKVIPQSGETSVTPDGDVVEKDNKIVCTKTAPSSMDCSKQTKVKVTKNNGEVIEKTVDNPLSDADLITNDNALVSIDYCVEHPDIIGCAKFGTPPQKELIPVTNAPVSLSPTSLGTGSCPAPKSISLSSQTITMSYQPQCDFATKIKPLIIAFAWLAAGFIVVGSIREA